VPGKKYITKIKKKENQLQAWLVAGISRVIYS